MVVHFQVYVFNRPLECKFGILGRIFCCFVWGLFMVYKAHFTPRKVTLGAIDTYTWDICHGPLARYDKLLVAHAPGMPGTFSPPPRVSDPDMHHDTCVTHGHKVYTWYEFLLDLLVPFASITGDPLHSRALAHSCVQAARLCRGSPVSMSFMAASTALRHSSYDWWQSSNRER